MSGAGGLLAGLLAAAAAAALAAGCERAPAAHTPSASAAPAADLGPGLVRSATAAAAQRAEILDVSFEPIYRIFLLRKVGQGPKAALWAERYFRRWVRWTGRIRSFTANGVTLRLLASTSTFDVSLWIDNKDRAEVQARYRVGDIVAFMGRLDSYDDIWRTLYLVNGVVIGPGSDAAHVGF